jgi:energy-coupling factor transporter ATP-binding protein EcfA2
MEQIKTLSRLTFLASFRKQWQQGEHLTIIGPTGSGKTTLALKLITAMPFVAIIGTKQRDDTLEKFAKQNKQYRIIKEFQYSLKSMTLDDTVIVWPKLKNDAGNVSVQAIPIHNSLNRMFFQGGWCIFCDELWYLANRLKQERILESFWSQGRSSGLSLVGCCQRPAWVPRFAFSEPRYLLIGQMEDERDINTVSEGTNISRKLLSQEVDQLSRHEFLFYNRNDRSITKIIG